MKSCPITYKKVDQNVIRVLSGLVFVLAVLFILHPVLIILIVLLYDFLVRILNYKKISPLFNLSRLLAKLMKLKKNSIDAGPKEFASKLGLVFVFCAFAIFLSGYTPVSVSIMAILAVCAFLELAFNYCIGCQIYMILKKFR